MYFSQVNNIEWYFKDYIAIMGADAAAGVAAMARRVC
jgi:hypothetical protein